MLIVFCLIVGLSQIVLALLFLGLSTRNPACSSMVCLTAYFTVFSHASIACLSPHILIE
jgi:hypothetical protein